MKNIFLLCFILGLLVFSCAGKPDLAETEIPESFYNDPIEEEEHIGPLPEDEMEDDFDDESEELNEEDLAEEFIEDENDVLAIEDDDSIIEEPIETVESEELAEITPEAETEEIELIDEIPQLADESEIAEESPVTEVAQPQEETPTDTATAVTQAPPVVTPMPPSAMLGPAEERRLEERRTPSSVARREEDRLDEQQAEESRRSLLPPERQTLPPFDRQIPSIPSARDDSIPTRSGLLLPSDEEIIFSRIVRATVGQIIEIPFRGSNWVYLGEIASRRGIVFNSSRREPEGMSFIFRAEEAGTYALRFFRRDHIRDYILNDHVQVIVGEAPSIGAGWFNPAVDRGRVVAEPRWPSALDEAAMLRGGTAATERPAETPRQTTVPQQPETARTLPQEETASDATQSQQQQQIPQQQTPQQTAAQTAPQQTAAIGTASAATALPQAAATSQAGEESQGSASNDTEDNALQPESVLAPEEYMRRAQEAFDGGNTGAAIALLDQFMTHYPGGSDEIYWLYGQFYEANTPHRNILLSLDYYRRLVNEYPQSRRLNDARRRIAYLERFYINIQ